MHQQYHFKSKLLPYLLIAPQAAVLTVFFLYPALQALIQSLYVQDAFGLSREFCGFDNFSALFRDDAYLRSSVTSVLFAAIVSTLITVGALVISWNVIQAGKASLAWRTAVMVPYAISPAVGGVLWVFLFNPTFGMVAEALKNTGIIWNHHTVPSHAFLLIVIIAVWKQLPYNLLFVILSMSNMSPALIEAATVDGAGPTKRFFHLVLPALGPTLFYLLTMNLAFAFFDSFAIIHQSTQGGPEISTMTLVYKVFKDGFLGMDQGSSSAQSLVLIVIMSVLAVFQFRKMEKNVVYF